MTSRPLALLPLLLPLAAPGTASATDLSVLVEAWTNTLDGQAGSDANDECADVAINLFGDVVAVGHLDGAPMHDKDGYAVAWGSDGTVLWDVTQDAGQAGPTQLSSDDRLFGVSIEPVTDNVAWCGRQGGSGVSGAPLSWYFVEALTANGVYEPISSWDQSYVDGAAATSPDQDCFGVEWALGNVHTAGWALHGADQGRWVNWRYEEAAGLAEPPYTYDFNQFVAVPDQALAVAVNTVTGDFVVVGTRGFSGAPGGQLNDTDWFVQYYAATYAPATLLWEHVHAGSSFLEDKALAVTIDTLTGNVLVAGFENNGSNNTTNSDRDWYITLYDGAGDGLGGPSVLWTSTYDNGNNTDEVATGIAIDELGDVLVGGWQVDSGSGLEVWRLAKLSGYDGVELQTWDGPVNAGDAQMLGLDFRDTKIAMGGWVDNGDDRDFAVTVLEGDRDFDGWGDSVDACPDDPLKTDDTGVCGCNISDEDTDGDGFENCLEDCATNPDKQDPGVCGCKSPDDDADADGLEDCLDNCPEDPNKTEWGICGCGSPDIDTDGDGVLGCDDACANTPPGLEVDEFGCELGEGETGDTGLSDGSDDGDKGGCGCDQPANPAGILAVTLGFLALRRRRD